MYNNIDYDNLREQSGLNNKKRSLVGGSLIWVAIGLMFTFMFAYLEYKYQFLYRVASNNMVALSITAFIAVAFLFIGSWLVYRMPWWMVLIYYAVFVVYEGIFVGYILIYSAVVLDKTEFVLLLALPLATTLLMGILGYFNIINFGRLYPLLIGLFIGVLIFSVVSWFVTSSKFFVIYGAIGYAFYSLMIGFKIWQIKRQQDMLITENGLPWREYMKITLIIGTSLLISILELIRFLFIILANTKS